MKSVLTTLLLFLSYSVFGQWVKLFEDDGQIIYYNSRRTEVLGSETTTWIKSEPKGQTLRDLISKFNNIVKDVSFNNYQYTIEKVTVRCGSLKYRSSGKTFYDQNGTVIYTTSITDYEWKETPPETRLEGAYLKLCELTKQ